MEVLLVATARRAGGATFYARKLASRIPAATLAADQPPADLLAALLRSRADVVHLEVEYATFGSVPRTLMFLPLLVLLRRLRSPVVLTLHGVVTRESLHGLAFPRLILAAFRASYFLSATLASAVTVHSERMRDVLREDYSVREALVIPHGSDPAPPTPRRPRPRHLVFFGFVRPSKGLEELIAAVGLLRTAYPEVRLTIAGGNPLPGESAYLETLRAEVVRSGCAENVSFLAGFLSEDQKAEVVSTAEALVLPYTDRYVEVSGVVHDLMASGIPMIVSDRPRFSELTSGVDCLKVPPEPHALSVAIRSLFEDPALAQRLGARLQQEAVSQSWDRVSERYRNLYETLVRAGRSSPRP